MTVLFLLQIASTVTGRKKRSAESTEEYTKIFTMFMEVAPLISRGILQQPGGRQAVLNRMKKYVVMKLYIDKKW